MKDQELLQEDFSLEEIMKEFSPEEEEQLTEELQEEMIPEEAPSGVTGDTVRISIPQAPQMAMDLGDTIQFEPIAVEEAGQPDEAPVEEAEASVLPEKAEPYSESWEPEYEQPMGDYVPPKPIMFRPRSKLQELKRQLVAGPERRYYELGEQGLGKLQLAIFFSVLVALLCIGATALHALGMVQPERLKAMIFGQFFAMLLSALLGCYQLMDGVNDLFRGRFSLNSLLMMTFLVCCADGVLCLYQQRIPCCAAFSLQVTMSLWSSYHRRYTELGQMDTLRKATRLNGVAAVEDYYDGCTGLVRREGRLEDFMNNYRTPSKPEKVLNVYALVAFLVGVVIGAVAGVLHRDAIFGVQVMAVTLLIAMPVTAFITVSRPEAILEKRLHRLGAVLCGWQGVQTLSRRAVFAMTHEDLFPAGACKLNGVKFYGSRNPDAVVAYCTAVVGSEGGGLAPLFEYLLESRGGRHYQVENLRSYPNGGIGGEVCGEPVLVGTAELLRQMGVEIPEGISVSQAVYAAIDGELVGVFAVTYNKVSSSAAGISTLCSYRRLRGVMTTGDFMLTEEFIRGQFRVNTRRMCFPDRAVRQELAAKEPEEETVFAALTTTEGLASGAYAVTGARSLRSAGRIGLVIHLLGGILGLAMMLTLAILGTRELLTPANVLLYEMAWLIPGLLVTEWTRSV